MEIEIRELKLYAVVELYGRTGFDEEQALLHSNENCGFIQESYNDKHGFLGTFKNGTYHLFPIGRITRIKLVEQKKEENN